jgi:hypothetical protein
MFLGACTVPHKFKIVMELLDGNLESLLLKGEGKNMSLFSRMCMAKQAAEGMNWLHCSDPAIIHRYFSSNVAEMYLCIYLFIIIIYLSFLGAHLHF